MQKLTVPHRVNGFFAPIERMFDEAFRSADRPAEERPLVPPFDFTETADAYVVAFDVPGADPEKVELTLEGERLELRAEKIAREVGEKDNCYRTERGRGTYQRTLDLPGLVDAEKIRAEAEHGVLVVTLPKREESKARRISIQTR